MSKANLEAHLCRLSLYDFVRRFWSVIISEKPVWNWHIEVICNELQTLAERVFRREKKEYDLIINVSPGSTKSTVCSVMFPMWCWTRDPTFRMICGSYGLELSMYLASMSQKVVTSEKFQALFPEIELSKETVGLLMNTRGGERKVTSTGGAITGMHGHVLLIDDPINPKEAVSDVGLKGANEWFDHTLLTRMIDKTITPIVLIMQRLHENDPTGHILERRATTPIRHLCLPARISDGVRPRSLRQFYKDGLFDPVRLPEEVLVKAQAELGAYAFAGQYMQRPTPMGGGMFLMDQVRLMPTAGAIVRKVRYWDKAGTATNKKRRGAWTAGVLMGVCKDRSFWILDVVRGQWEASERERIIKQTAVMDGRDTLVAIEQEPGSGGKESAQGTLKNLAGWRVKIDRPVGDKEVRAEPFSVQVNGGNVKMVRGAWNAEYLRELQYFPFSTWKDQVDASSGAFAILTGKRLMVGAFGHGNRVA